MARLTPAEARRGILAAANDHNQYLRLTPRHLQRAVFICRQHRLVKPLTLQRAGFQPTTNRRKA